MREAGEEEKQVEIGRHDVVKASTSFSSKREGSVFLPRDVTQPIAVAEAAHVTCFVFCAYCICTSARSTSRDST